MACAVITVAAAVTAAAAFTGCTPGDDGDFIEPAPSSPGVAVEAATLPAPDVVDAVAPSLVRVRVGGRDPSTGVVWRDDGLVLATGDERTSSRGIVSIVAADGRTHRAGVVGRDERTTLVLLRVDARLPPAAFAIRQPRLGARAVAVALSEEEGTEVSVGAIAAIGARLERPAAAPIGGLLRTDDARTIGRGGAVLADEHGDVVGIEVGRTDDGTYAVPASVAVAAAGRILAACRASPACRAALRALRS